MNFRNDYSAVQNLGADILFIQECERLPRDSFEGFDFHWVGQNEKKGLLPTYGLGTLPVPTNRPI